MAGNPLKASLSGNLVELAGSEEEFLAFRAGVRLGSTFTATTAGALSTNNAGDLVGTYTDTVFQNDQSSGTPAQTITTARSDSFAGLRKMTMWLNYPWGATNTLVTFVRFEKPRQAIRLTPKVRTMPLCGTLSKASPTTMFQPISPGSTTVNFSY